MKKNIKIAYLKESDTIKTIAEQYWQTDERNKFIHKINDIGKPFGFNARDIGLLMKANVQAQSQDYHCDDCGAPYIFNNRGHFAQKFRPPWQCKVCEIAEEERRIIAQIREDQAKHEWLKQHDHQSLTVDQLSLQDAIFLLAFIRYCVSEDLTHLESYTARSNASLSPTPAYDEIIRQQLKDKDIIVIDPDSDLDAISLDDDGIRYYPSQVKWKVSYDPTVYASLADFIQMLEIACSQMSILSEHWLHDIDTLGREVLYQECLAYLNLMMTEHRFKFSPKEKTRRVITKALEDFAVAQVWNFIWGAVKEAEHYFNTADVMRPIAANSAIGRIQTRYERAHAGGYEVKAFDRPYRLPLSTLSQVLFITLLKLDKDWFYQPWSHNWA